MLPGVFCRECHESRDVNLCNLPQDINDNGSDVNQLACPDCGTLYPTDDIERRLIEICNRQIVFSSLARIKEVLSNCRNTANDMGLSNVTLGLIPRNRKWQSSRKNTWIAHQLYHGSCGPRPTHNMYHRARRHYCIGIYS
jgi:hypothetical protein